MSGLDFNPTTGRLQITTGSRVVSTTDGTLVCLLPTVHTFTDRVANYPDLEKDEAYLWTWGVAQNPLADPTTYAKGEWCSCMITAVPQEYSAQTVLMAAPAGADFFVGQVRLTRDIDPASTWMGRTIQPLVVENQWIPWQGSCLLEAETGMARALHIYISGGNLVLEVEQSVSVPVNGYSSFGDGVSPFNQFGGGGGEVLFNSKRGIPVFMRSQKSYGYTSFSTNNSTPTQYRRNGTSPCARSDTTNYRSRYLVDIQGKFGIRS